MTIENYGKMGIQASNMKEELHNLANQYVGWRELMYFFNKNKKKYPKITKPERPTMAVNTHEGLKTKIITLGRVEAKQISMNKLRRKVGLRPYNIIANINKRIVKYKRSNYGSV